MLTIVGETPTPTRVTVEDLLPDGVGLQEALANTYFPPGAYTAVVGMREWSLLNELVDEQVQKVVDERRCLKCATAVAGRFDHTAVHPIMRKPVSLSDRVDEAVRFAFTDAADGRTLSSMLECLQDAMSAGYGTRCNTKGCQGSPYDPRAVAYASGLLALAAAECYASASESRIRRADVEVVLVETGQRVGAGAPKSVKSLLAGLNPRLVGAAAAGVVDLPGDWQHWISVVDVPNFDLAEQAGLDRLEAISVALVLTGWLNFSS